MTQPSFDLTRRLFAEALGTALLLAVVIGSGIMGERLAGGNVAIALLGNTLATGAGLVVLITVSGPISGAHFNPAVSLVFALRRELSWLDASEEPFAIRATADGMAPTRVEPRAVGHVSIGNLSWQPVGLSDQPAPGARLTLESGAELELGRAPSWGERRVMLSRDASVTFIVTSRHGDCGSRDRFLVERLAAGQRVELWAGEDAYPILEEGADGALYIQAGDETRRFPDLGATGAAGQQTLRPGLGLTSSAHDVNPYC